MTTLKAAKHTLATIGWTIVRTGIDGEYRTHPRNARLDGFGYFTNDLDDAVATAQAEHARMMEFQRSERCSTRNRVADRIDGYDRDDLGASPD